MVLISRSIQVIILISLTLRDRTAVFDLGLGGVGEGYTRVYVICISALKHTEFWLGGVISVRIHFLDKAILS